MGSCELVVSIRSSSVVHMNHYFSNLVLLLGIYGVVVSVVYTSITTLLLCLPLATVPLNSTTTESVVYQVEEYISITTLLILSLGWLLFSIKLLYNKWSKNITEVHRIGCYIIGSL